MTDPGQILGLAGAVERLKNEARHMASFRIRNEKDELLLFVRETFGWIGHYFLGEAYKWSFLSRDSEAAESLLPAFSEGDEWSELPAGRFRLDEWEALVQTGSGDLALNLSRRLADNDIPHTVASADFSLFNPIYGTRHSHHELSILTPAEHLDRAAGVMRGFHEEIERLRDEAERFAEANDHDGELKTYDRLLELVTDDPEIYFNKAVVHFDREQFLEAAEAFMNAAQANQSWEHLPEVRDYLERIREQLPDENLDLLHTLSSIAQIRNDNDKALFYLKKIIEKDPSDAVAHLNLGFLYYENPERSADAVRHLRKYLEIEPKADDRPAVEAVLSSLE